MKRILTHPLFTTAIVFAILPFVMPGANPFVGHVGFVDLATEIIVFSLFALGFNLLFGHLGELSFGHAMFFTLGAYVTALFTKGFSASVFGIPVAWAGNNNALVTLVLSLAVVLLWGWFLARIIVPRSSGIYYSMITLAFAQVIFFVTYKWGELTGGEDGLQGVARPILPFFPPDYLRESVHMFYFTAVVAFVAVALVWWIIASPFGSVCHAIRENKERAAFLGYDVNKYRVNMFVLSTIFPCVAGWLWTYYQQAINPDAGSIDYSGRVVMMSLLGGINTFFGPMIGSLVYWELQNNISQQTKYWPAAIGIVFAFFVLVAPRGIMGTIEDIQHYGFAAFFQRLFSRTARVQTDVAEELPPTAEVPELSEARP
jgi:branched-chain amino acid transport system permease protein